MQYFANLKIGTRLAWGFLAIIVVAVGMAVSGYLKLEALSRHVAELTSDQMVKVDALSQMKDNHNVIARGVRNIILISDEAGKLAEKKRINEMQAENVRLFAELQSSMTHPRGVELMQQVVAATAAYEAAQAKAIRLGLEGDDPAAISALLKEVRPVQKTYFAAADALIDWQQAEMRQAGEDIRAASARGGLLMLALAGIAAVFGLFIAWAVTRSIVRPLGEAAAMADRVSAGDLAHDVPVRSNDEIGRLLTALQRMRLSLVQIVGGVRGNAQNVATASAEIAMGNLDLSQRTEQQASALQQTAATMDELGATVRNNAESARQAHELASGAADVARQGGQTVGHMVTTMRGIHDSARQIAEITGVIDGIAFQTNILALNAAVESARAGEQGRGFAVVAGEVRHLAQRCAEAAKDIKGLIERSVTQVEQGTTQAERAGRSMLDVVAAVEGVSQAVAAISAAGAQQSAGVAQVGQAVSQMDHATQQNAALVEQSASAAESLKQQAASLVQAVAVFKLGQEGALAA